MGNGRKKLKIEIFFERYFGNFKKILTANLLFGIPSAAILIGYYFLNDAIFGGINPLFSLSVIVLLYPLYAGVVMVVRNIVRGDDGQASVAKAFFAAIRQNFLLFLLHGAAVSAASILSYLALTVYTQLLSTSWIMYVLLFFCILVVLMALFSSFYLPLMTLTYDIKLRYLYKNSFLMSFGEFKHNFFALLALAMLGALCLTATAFLPNVTVLLVVLLALWVLFIPATFTFCYTFFIYEGMVSIIENKAAVGRELDDKISAKAVAAGIGQKTVDDNFDDIDISQLKDTDDFIYHNGRMIKQSALLKMLREKEASAQGADQKE